MDTVKMMLLGILIVLDGIFLQMLVLAGLGEGSMLFFFASLVLVIGGSGLAAVAYMAGRNEKK